MFAVAHSRQVKLVIESQIDALFDSVLSGGISHENALASLRGAIKDVPSIVHSLGKRYLVRAFTVVGRESEAPTSTKSVEIKAARSLLFNLLVENEIGDDSSEISIGTDGSGELNDQKHDVSDEVDEEKSIVSDVREVVAPIPRSSPRKSLTISRAARVSALENNEIASLKEQVARLQKQHDERKENDTQAIAAALGSIPSMSSGTGRKHSKNLHTSVKSSDIGTSKGRSGRKHGKKKRSARYGTDSSSSESDSSSSSSSSTDSSSSSSDSDRVRRRSKHKNVRTHHSRSPRRYAKQIIKNVGKEGCVVYLNRIVMVSQNAGKKVDHRSVHEASTIGAALDAMVADGIRSSTDACEILATRFIGLVHVIKTGDWTFMSGVQFKSGVDSLPLSTKQMTKIMKQGAVINSMSASSTKPNRYVNPAATGNENGNVQRTGKKGTNEDKDAKIGTTYDKSGSKAQ